MLNWSRLMEHHRHARSQQHERIVLTQLGALLAFMVDPSKVNTLDRMQFVFRLQLAFSGTAVWDDVENLIYAACRDYPVR